MTTRPGPEAREPAWTRSLRATTRVALGTVLAVGDHAAQAVRTATERAEAAGAPGTEREPASAIEGASAVERSGEPAGSPVPGTDAAPGESGVRPVLIGALFAAEDRVVDLSATVARAAPVLTRPWRLGIMRPVRDRVDGVLDDLRRRGADEEEAARATAAHAFDATVERATGSAVIDETVNDVVGRIIDPVIELAVPKAVAGLQQRPETLVPLVESIVSEVLQPILDQALPQVIEQMKDQPELLVPFIESLVTEIIDPVLQLALPKAIQYLNEDPTVVRDLVRDQSTGIAGELAGEVRTRAVTADDRIERIAAKILRRRAPAIEQGPTAELDASQPLDALPPASEDQR